MSSEQLAMLLAATVDDLEVRERLLPLGQPAFAVALVELAAERGLSVDHQDVDEAVRAARRAWFERWV